MAKNTERPYKASDLKELMDNTGGWAKDWEDVLRYLKGPAERDADFAKNEVPALIEDIQKLKKDKVKFTTDYRVIWEKITGADARDLPEPEGVKKPPTNPVELEDKFLEGIQFPAKKKQVIERAKANDAPERVINVLNEVEDKEFKDMPGLLEAVGDVTWDHD